MGRRAYRVAAAAAVLATLAVTGCGSVYKKDTDCPGYLETGNCYDLREAYEAANNFDREEYRRKLRGQEESGDDQAGTPAHPVYRPAQPYMVSDDQPRPILTQAVPARVFIDPYEDKAGRLHTPGYIYVRVQESKWMFGNDETKKSRVVTPLVRDN